MKTWLELQSKLKAAQTILWHDHHSLVAVAEYQLDFGEPNATAYLEIRTEVCVA
jgi:hypothetical protein